jgi:hypothetical protein
VGIMYNENEKIALIHEYMKTGGDDENPEDLF